MRYSNEYREAASRAYLDHIKSIAELAALLNMELTLAVVNELGEGYIDSILEKRSQYEEEIEEAEQAISNLDETTADVLRRQYIDLQSQNDIADEIGYVTRTVQRFAKSGREELFDYIPIDYR